MNASRAALRADPERRAQARPFGVVICGSFRRGLDQLRSDRDAFLEADCEILSPLDVEFVREENGFVFSRQDDHLAPGTIEANHISALRSADLVWLHAPDGYLGPSAAFELGVAAAAGMPVFAREVPRDVALRGYVHRTSGPAAAATAARKFYVADPGAGVGPLQKYYARVAADRGWENETALESMVLLTEELGELARALRLSRESNDHGGDEGPVAAELADVQLYVVHLANVLGLDLAAAVTAKEAVNALRFERRARAA